MAVKDYSADIMQREMLEREKELSHKSRFCDIFLTAIFCLFIIGFTVLHIVTPDKEYSDRENRVLQTLPEFSIESLFSGEYSSQMTKYLSDQFPMRDTFVSIKSSSERIALRMENSGIIFGDNSLTAKLDSPDMGNLDTNVKAADKFAEALENKGIPCIFAPAPRRVDVCIDDLPKSYGDAAQNELWSTIDSYADSFSGTFISGIRNILRGLTKSGSDVFYRTDHHWTTPGAYNAYEVIYTALPDNIKAQIPQRELYYFFTPETVTEEFYGTSYSSSGASWVTPDKIELYRFEGDDKIPVTVVDTNTTYEGLYRTEYLDTRDKYSVFIGENAGRVDIGYGDRPKIVVIKDSFAQSFVPFLATDFDVVMIDPRYFSGSIFRAVEEIDPEAVLILMNVDTLTSDDVLKVLIRGIK